MPIEINTSFTYQLDQVTDVLLQFEAAAIPEQQLSDVKCSISETEHCARVAAQDGIGERVWVRAEGRLKVKYQASAVIDRIVPDLTSLARLEPHDLPGETIKYLFDSRYCQADRMQSFVEAEFGDCQGGARIEAFKAWIADNFVYEPGSSTATTTALDSFVERRGICRDYAHVLITFARASTIPARYVACYAPQVDPPDFHAVAEVFLEDKEHPHGGAWHIVDPSGMAHAGNTVKIGVGRDAADVSFLTAFGTAELCEKEVEVCES